MPLSDPHRRGSASRSLAGSLRRIVPVVVEGGVWILLVATPLALGSVSETAIALMEGACFALLVIAWWAAPAEEGAPLPRPLVMLATAFAGWTLVQMIPMPAPVLRWVAPGTDALYRQYSPGYAGGSGGGRIESALLERREAESAGLTLRREDRTGFEKSFAGPRRARPISWYPEHTFRWLSRFLAYGALCILVARYLPARARTHRIPWLLLSLGFGIALLGIIQHLTWNGKIYWVIPVYQGYPFGPWVNNNHFSGYLEMVLPLGGAVLLRDLGFGRKRRRSSPSTAPRRLLAAFMLGMMVVALLMAGSRGGLFSIGLSGAMLPLLRVGRRGSARGMRMLAIGILPLALVSAGILWYTFEGPEGGAPTERGVDPSFAGRVNAWKGVLEMIRANPITGTGLGTFSLAYPVYKTYGNTAVWDQAHDEYLQLLAESGVVGFGIGLAALIWVTRRHLVPLLSRGWSRAEPAVLGAGIGIAILLIHSLVDFNLQIPSNGLLFSMLGGILIAGSGASAEGGSGSPDGAPVGPKALN